MWMCPFFVLGVRPLSSRLPIGDFSESLPAGREEAAKQTPLAQFFQPRLPRLRAVVPSRSKIAATSREIAALPSRNSRPV